MPESLCADYSPMVIREAEAQIIKLLLPPLLPLPLLLQVLLLLESLIYYLYIQDFYDCVGR